MIVSLKCEQGGINILFLKHIPSHTYVKRCAPFVEIFALKQNKQKENVIIKKLLWVNLQ